MSSKEVIIIEYSNVSAEGVTLHTNIPAALTTGNVKGTSFWVSWDKIGYALFKDYTGKDAVEERDMLRKNK